MIDKLFQKLEELNAYLKQRIETQFSKDIDKIVDSLVLPKSFVSNFFLTYKNKKDLSFDFESEDLINIQIAFDNYFNQTTEIHQETLLKAIYDTRKYLACLKESDVVWFSNFYKNQKEKLNVKISEMYKESVEELKDLYLQQHFENILRTKINSETDFDDEEEEEEKPKRKKKYQ